VIQHLSEENRRLKDELEVIKKEIMQAMVSAQELTYEGKVLATWKNTKPAKRIDIQSLKASFPDVCEQFMVEGVVSRRFCIKEGV
jgi:hypothetical protein